MTETDRQRYTNIARKLVGEFYLRCVKPCGECKGSGECEPPFAGYDSGSCGKCSGTGLVFREDERGRNMIYNAILEFSESDMACEDIRLLDYYPEDVPSTWDNRRNQPWQADLESFVRTYEADPPDLSDERKLKRLLRESVHTYDVCWSKGEGFAAHVISTEGKFEATDGYDTESAALLAAVEAMLSQTKGE